MNKVIEEAIAELKKHARGEAGIAEGLEPRQVFISYTDHMKRNAAYIPLADSGTVNHFCPFCLTQFGTLPLSEAKKLPYCESCGEQLKNAKA